MTNHDLKELTNLGAELGAAKAENEKLRQALKRIIDRCEAFVDDEAEMRTPSVEVLMGIAEDAIYTVHLADAALSQQAEPTDTYTAVDMATAAAQGFRDGQAAVEQAPVQDEREAVERFSPTTSVPHCGRASEVEAYMTEDDDGEYMTVSQHERIVAALTRPAQTEQLAPFTDLAAAVRAHVAHCSDFEHCDVCQQLNAQAAPQHLGNAYRDMLDDLQWQWRDYNEQYHIPCGYYCPSCHAPNEKGHDADCELNALLASPIAQTAPQPVSSALSAVTAERDGLAAARMAYASEFAPDEHGDPDVGSVHANIRALKAERDRLESTLIQTTTRHFAQQWKDRADDKKLDECLSEGIAMLEAERDQLRAEVEALRKDAERYRWLRDQAPKARGEWEIDGQRYGMMLGADQDDVDEAVDALMSAMAAKEA